MSPVSSGTSRPRQVLLNFHATAPEVLALAARSAEELGVAPVLRFAFPFAVRATTVDELRADDLPPGRLLAVDLPAAAADLDVTSDREYVDRVPDRLAFALGLSIDGTLRAASMGGVTTLPPVLAGWRRLRDRLRATLGCGATLTDAQGRHARHVPHHYTSAAVLLAREGVRMLPVAGDAEYHFDLLDPTP